MKKLRGRLQIEVLAISGIVLGACCKVGPVYEPPKTDVPCEWNSEVPPELGIDATNQEISWEALQDPLLNELMAYAYGNNLDLKIAAIRVLQARAEAEGKKGDLYPHVDASANYGHVYYSKNALVNGLIAPAGVTVNPKDIRRNVNFYEIGFDAEWELDFFGLTAHEIAALKAHEEAVEESLCGVWVTLSAEIAKNYIELRGLQQHAEKVRHSIEAQTQAIQLTQQLVDREVVSQGDWERAKGEWNILKRELSRIEWNVTRTIHRLSILIGVAPGTLFECLSPCTPLPSLPCEFSVGVPSELLRRRPDIRKAERELAAATERVGSAIAALFPRFSLRGFVGDISTHIGSLFSPASTMWFAGPQVLIPIFNSRLLLQEVNYSKLSTKEALHTYQKTVLEALEEAENGIASFRYEKERLSEQREAYQHYRNALTFAQERYERGVGDRLAVIEAEKAMLETEKGVLESEVALLLSYIGLYKALGGCCTPCPDSPA